MEKNEEGEAPEIAPTDDDVENPPRRYRQPIAPPHHSTLSAESRARKRRKMRPRCDVWAELQKMDFDPIRNLVEMSLDPNVSDKIRSDINQELLAYCAAKKRPEIKLAEDTVNPLAEIMSAIAGQPRPKPATASVVVDDEGDDEGEDD